MMNKLKSARLNMIRFLFVLPLVAVVLVSFRKNIIHSLANKQQEGTVVKNTVPADAEKDKKNDEMPADAALPSSPSPALVHFTDSVPPVKEPNDKGYYIDVKGDNGDCIVVVKDKAGKEAERVLMTKWKEKEAYYENKYGEIPPPPMVIPPVPPVPPPTIQLPPNVISINASNDKVTVRLKNGSEEKYDLNIPQQKANFEKKYHKLPEPPVPPAPPARGSNSSVSGRGEATALAALGEEFEITDKKAVIHLKNGKTEEYDLTNTGSRGQFEKKYGRITGTGSNTTGALSPVAFARNGSGLTAIAPMAPLSASGTGCTGS